ncbi:MAG: acetyltransferase [Polaromonas sp.]|uniref:acetyltransferase n=1 Tax=Polaromonas sp. TaxID=1869339 RepID=UPI0027311948|nr:acetyltransferase [Polaromonas sp.]MDP2450444.1 acetyltransferase [Polaromonas sp.]MDP3247180.1 acetyltransferase [Polaromonas sp.]MDP3756618.1 acetyltransferase [Polaromonas sp.]MDP3827642.1 acetyltransferase [Polaromonas sp.]
MSKPSLILVGAGGHAHACIDVIEQQGRYQIAGLIGMPDEVDALRLGYSVLATDADLHELASQYQHAFISVGQIRSPDVRIRLYCRLLELGFQLPTVISPAAYVSRHATIGVGSIVMHGAVVNAGAEVGDNCIINSRALVEHDAIVEANCHISTGAILNGNTRVGAGSYVGSGSVIREGIALGEGCMVGMGLSVRHSQASGTRFVG